jgi:hypothetical protein
LAEKNIAAAIALNLSLGIQIKSFMGNSTLEIL